jgi:hypothetical protein
MQVFFRRKRASSPFLLKKIHKGRFFSIGGIKKALEKIEGA